MELYIEEDARQLGKRAAKLAAQKLKETIREKGEARLVLSTGASQFETLDALVQEDVPWDRVVMFHLDEYVNLPDSHPASFRKYLRERFIGRVSLREAVLVQADKEPLQEELDRLTAEYRKAPIDVALIGIGENGHTAFNDPPADFATKEAYIVVDLDQACKEQQVREKWFANIDAVPKQAISMTVHQIMQSKAIISCVPHRVKAEAVREHMTQDVNPLVPATMLKQHPDWHLFLDRNSASLLPQ